MQGLLPVVIVISVLAGCSAPFSGNAIVSNDDATSAEPIALFAESDPAYFDPTQTWYARYLRIIATYADGERVSVPVSDVRLTTPEDGDITSKGYITCNTDATVFLTVTYCKLTSTVTLEWGGGTGWGGGGITILPPKYY